MFKKIRNEKSLLFNKIARREKLKIGILRNFNTIEITKKLSKICKIS